MYSIYGKIVWITGASSGIGEAISHEIARKGPSKIILSARRKKELERVQKDLCLFYNRPKENVLIVSLDLCSPKSIKEAFQNVKCLVSCVDVLINNGGLDQKSLFEETDMDVYRQIMEINFFSIILLTKLVLPMMQKNKTGVFVAVSSVLGKFSIPLQAGYSASKHALIGLYDSLRTEVERDGIHVLLVCPGYVNTNISKNALLSDGSKYNIESSEKGISAEQCAKKIVLAIQKQKRETYPSGLKERLAVYLRFFVPSLLNKIVKL